MIDEDYCLWHSPDHQEAAQQARSAGGRRRQKDQITHAMYDIDDFNTFEGLERLLAIAALDTLHQDNSPGRTRGLIAVVKTQIDLIRHIDLHKRFEALEQAIDEDYYLEHQ